MNNFFKPTIWKIVIAVLLLNPIPHMTCVSYPLNCKTAYLSIAISWLSTMPASGITINPLGTTGCFGVILLLIGVALSYIISCVISAIYAKLSTKIRR